MRTIYIQVIVKISILSAGCFFLVLTGINLVENFQHERYMEKACSNPGTNCPVEDPWYMVSVAVPGLVLALLGAYLMTSEKVQEKK